MTPEPDHQSPDVVAATVRRYYAVVADLASTESDLRAVVDPEAVVVEHPNAITPAGARRSLDETVQGFLAGKTLLAKQTFDIHELLVQGDRAAVRATWTGTIGVDRGPVSAGDRLVAQVAAFVTVRDGHVVAHETFDCYEPFGS